MLSARHALHGICFQAGRLLVVALSAVLALAPVGLGGCCFADPFWVSCAPLCLVLCPRSVFLFFVMRRLLDIQGQLYSMRALAKEAATQQQLLLTAGSAGSGGEQQLLLSRTLSRMARSSVDGQEVAVGSKQD